MFIIADVGSNWVSKQDLLESVVAAKKAGADAFKIQYYTHKKLYNIEGDNKYEIPEEWVWEIYNKCVENHIEFVATIFDKEDIPMFSKMLKTWKISSFEATDLNFILNIVDAMHDKDTLLISTGCLTIEAIRTIKRKIILKNRDIRVVYLYCDSHYPARALNLRYLELISDNANICKENIGVSDHTNQIHLASTCYDYGCKYYEKHFKIREFDSPDNDHSLNCEEFEKMVNSVAKVKLEDSYNKSRVTGRVLIANEKIEKNEPIIEGSNAGWWRIKV